ncbi:hypothetical protein Tco_0766247 [Tanacetum coccineum]
MKTNTSTNRATFKTNTNAIGSRHRFDLIDGVVAANNPVLDHFPEYFEHVTLYKFKHARALEFFNHDAYSELVADSFEQEQVSKFIAGKNYAPGDEVRIKYGDIPNALLFMSKMGIQRKIDEAVQRETSGRVPNTLVIANGDVVKPKVAAAEHIS